MAFGINTGANGAQSVPAPSMQTLSSAYIDFTASGTTNWAQQYVPDLYEKEAEVFGNRSVSGFLEMVGAEEAMTSDQVVWSEQGRLHIAGTGSMDGTTDGLMTCETNADGVTATDVGIRTGDMILLSDADQTIRGYVTDVYGEANSSLTSGQFQVASYESVTLGLSTTSKAVSFFVFGSEYQKGTTGRENGLTANFKSFKNQPIIMKDKYEVSGSDASQIGWVEVSGEDGQNGYLWYLKAAGDTKTRFADYCEMALVEAVKANGTSDVNSLTGNLKGTEGLFAAVEDRGHVQYGYQDTLDTANTIALTDFDNILKEFDKNGAIEEYMIFANRSYTLSIDDLLAEMNTQAAGATSYGVFNNEADMALNLGFSGFRRGSYDFYKTDWKYLNDAATRGGMVDAKDGLDNANAGAVFGMFIPAGVSTVYDQNLGKNLKRPFLHVRYRASATDDRRFKTWSTGSVGATTSDLDALEMHFLTERCLVVQGANNFMMIRG